MSIILNEESFNRLKTKTQTTESTENTEIKKTRAQFFSAFRVFRG
jgi:hypothetical protein